MRSLGKSDFGSLARYITDAQSKDHRLGQVRVTNCASDGLAAAIEEILATQYLNTRAVSDKTYHLIVSFRAGEVPDTATLEAIEARVCAGLGFAEHQRVSAVHNDTDNLHIHIAINKIHPARHTIHEPYYQHLTLAELCVILEGEYGLERDNHLPQQKVASAKASDMERHTGVESLVGWIKRECLQEIRATASWAELHEVLHKHGLELKTRGNGLVVVAEDGTMVKASTLARELSKPALESRFGPFEASPELPAQASSRRGYGKDPLRLRVNTTELYARYTQEQKRLTAARSEALAKARRQKERAIKAAKRANRLRRSAIKLLDGRGINKKLLYAQASAAMRASLATILRDYAAARDRHYQGFQRRAWADWLKHEAMQGNTEALAALRAREAAQGLQGHTLAGQRAAQPGYAAISNIDSITKKGTIIYRAGLSAVRDDGDRLQVSREATAPAYQAALRLAAERYGSQITVNGNAEFKAHMVRAAVDTQLPITFADPGLERRRQALLTKKEPANDRDNRQRNGGRLDRRGFGGPGSGPTANHDPGRATGAQRGRTTGRGLAKRNLGRLGCVPPPASQNRLRAMSELGVVRIASGSEMLLPRDVPGQLEQRRTESAIPLRRRVPGPVIGPEQGAAADKYIAEREGKRLKGFDIPKHTRYTETGRPLAFAGSRQIDGCTVALLKCDATVLVLPVDATSARRLKRISLGEAVRVTDRGLVRARKKGHSR